MKPSTVRALLIGFMVGVVLYSVFNNSLGLATLIPLLFVYWLTRDDRDDSTDAQD